MYSNNITIINPIFSTFDHHNFTQVCTIGKSLNTLGLREFNSL